MPIKFTRFIAFFVILFVSGLLNSPVMAETSKPEVYENEPLTNSFERAFHDSTGNAFDRQTMLSQFKLIFGIGYPENEIRHNGRLVDIIYEDGLEQQTTRNSNVRTRDLNNPFTSSLQENPDYSGS